MGHRRPNPSPPSAEDRQDERLDALPRGPLGPEEVAALTELRSAPSVLELEVLRSPSLRVLRDPRKRLAVLDLLRWDRAASHGLFDATWSALPFLVGLPWIRPLDRTPVGPVGMRQLAEHLLCEHAVPGFLFGPFEDPDGYGPDLGWALAQLVPLFGVRAPLQVFLERSLLPAGFNHRMYRAFLRTPEGTPVMTGLRQAQVDDLGGPDWLGAVLNEVRRFSTLQGDRERFVEADLRWLCAHPMTPHDARRVVRYLDRGRVGPLGDMTLDALLAACPPVRE